MARGAAGGGIKGFGSTGVSKPFSGQYTEKPKVVNYNMFWKLKIWSWFKLHAIWSYNFK